MTKKRAAPAKKKTAKKAAAVEQIREYCAIMRFTSGVIQRLAKKQAKNSDLVRKLLATLPKPMGSEK